MATIADKRAANAARSRRCRQKKRERLATLQTIEHDRREVQQVLLQVSRQLLGIRRAIADQRPARNAMVVKQDDRRDLAVLFDFIEQRLDELSTACDVASRDELRDRRRDPMGLIDLRLLTTTGKASTR